MAGRAAGVAGGGGGGGGRGRRGRGWSSRPLRAGRLRYPPDVTREAGYLPSLNSGSEVDVPLRAGDRVFGVLVVESNRKNAFRKNDFEILTAAATQASIALGRARLLDAERRRADEQQAVLETLADLSGELELGKLLQSVLRRATTLLGVSGGELAIFDEANAELEVVASQQIGVESRGTRLKVGEGAMGHVARTREPICIAEYHEWTGQSTKYAAVDVHSVMAGPLLIGHRLVGVFALTPQDSAGRLGPRDIPLLNPLSPPAPPGSSPSSRRRPRSPSRTRGSTPRRGARSSTSRTWCSTARWRWGRS